MKKLIYLLFSFFLLPIMAMEPSADNLNKQLFDVLGQFNNNYSETIKDEQLAKTALENCKNSVQRLIAAGADPNAKDNRGCPLLMMASGSEELSKILIDNGADIHTTIDIDGEKINVLAFSLFIAIGFKQDFRVSKLLLKHGADINSACGPNITLPICVIESLLCSSLIEKDQQPYCLQCLKFLIEHGANVNTWIDYSKTSNASPGTIESVPMSTLMFAISGRPQRNATIRPQVVQCLLDAGADIHARNLLGHTPLICAAINTTDEIMDRDTLNGLNCCRLILNHQKELIRRSTFAALLCFHRMKNENSQLTPLYRNFKVFFAKQIELLAMKELLSAQDNQGHTAYYYLADEITYDLEDFDPERYK